MYSFPNSSVEDLQDLTSAPDARTWALLDDRSPWSTRLSGGSSQDKPQATLDQFSDFAVPLHLAEPRSGRNGLDSQFDGDLWVPGDFGKIVRLTCITESIDPLSGTESSDRLREHIRDDLRFLAINLRNHNSAQLWGALAKALSVMNRGDPLEPQHSAPLINLVARCVRGEVPPRSCRQILNHISTDHAPLATALRLDVFMNMLDELPTRRADTATFQRIVWNIAGARDGAALLGTSCFVTALTLYNSPSLLARMRSDTPKSLAATSTFPRNAAPTLAPTNRPGAQQSDPPESLAILNQELVEILKNGASKAEVVFHLSLSLELGIQHSQLAQAVEGVRSFLQVRAPVFSALTPSQRVSPVEVLALRLNKSCTEWQSTAENIIKSFITIVEEGTVDPYKLSARFATLAGIFSQTVGGEKLGPYVDMLLCWAASTTDLRVLISLTESLASSDCSSGLSVPLARYAHFAQRERRTVVTSRFLGALLHLQSAQLPLWQNAGVLMEISHLPSDSLTEFELLMTTAIDAIRDGVTLSVGPHLAEQLLRSTLPVRTKDSLVELHSKLTAVMQLNFLKSLETNQLAQLSEALRGPFLILQRSEDIPDAIIDSTLGDFSDVFKLTSSLRETTQHLLHWLAAPAVAAFISSSDGAIRSLRFNEIDAAHDLDGSWPPLGTPAAPSDVQTPKHIQDEVVHVWRRSADATALRAEKFPARRPTPPERSHHTEFGRQVALESTPIELAPERAGLYPGPGVIYEGMNLDRILGKRVRGESHLDPFRKAWPWAVDALADSADAVYIHTQGFDAVIPPRNDLSESRYTLFDSASSPVAHYSFVAFSDVRRNPAGLGSYLVPTDRLVMMWQRNQAEGGYTRSFSTTAAWRDSTHLLRFFQEGAAPVINLSDCCALSGFHKSFPPHFFPFEEAFKGGSRRRDSSGHLLLQFLPPDELSRVLSEFNLDTRKLHDSVRVLAHSCFDLLCVERLYRMKWHKGNTQIQLDSPWPFKSHIKGVPPSAFMMLHACYQWHQRRLLGDTARDGFPVFTIGKTLERWGRLDSMPIIDTYDMTLTTNGKKFQLRPDAYGEAREQELWYTHVHLEGYNDDMRDYKLCDREGFNLAT